MRSIRHFLVIAALAAATPADAQQAPAGEKPPSVCDFVKGNVYRLLEEWKTSCTHPLCGHVFIAQPELLKAGAASCEGKEFMSMRDDIRATVVAGGAVLVGEVHDNPLHHELRSRFGLSQFASVVFEQIDTGKAGALEAFGKETGFQYKEGALEKLKAAVAWEKSGWQQYNYDPLLTAALKGQVPIFAGDATREIVKAAAKDGAAAVSPEERKRLKLDIPLGEKTDAAVLDELYESHCQQVERGALINMAFAQRVRDATLADAALGAIAKRHSTIVFTGNGHVRKDRGIPWYIHQASGEKKTLAIMILEVEEGKNSADDYVPKDAEGKPAADYVIFTPRTERKDPCESMKAKP